MLCSGHFCAVCGYCEKVNVVYRHLLKDLIVQSLLRLKEPYVLLRCQKEDLHLVEHVLDSATQEYALLSKFHGFVQDSTTGEKVAMLIGKWDGAMYYVLRDPTTKPKGCDPMTEALLLWEGTPTLLRQYTTSLLSQGQN